MIEPPPIGDGALAYVIWIAREDHGCRNAQPDSAIEQDLGIVGDDVVDFVERLEKRFGSWVWDWPWQRFTDLNEGLSLLFPFMLIWQWVT